MTRVQHAFLLLTDDSSAVISNRVNVLFLAVPRTVLFNYQFHYWREDNKIQFRMRYHTTLSTFCTSESLASVKKYYNWTYSD